MLANRPIIIKTIAPNIKYITEKYLCSIVLFQSSNQNKIVKAFDMYTKIKYTFYSIKIILY